MSERCHEIHIKTMKKFRVICPHCTTSFLVDKPEALVWERCPACRVHVWDAYDALMADKVSQSQPSGEEPAARSN